MRYVLILLALVLGFGAQDVAAKDRGCPPGLAKKSPACVPPGLAKKDHYGDSYRDDGVRHHDRDHRYRRGEIIPGDYIIIHDPYRYGLDRNYTYARRGDYVYRIDRETREVLDLIGAVAAILN